MEAISITEASKPPYPIPQRLVDWLNEGRGRAAYFSKVDPCLFPPMISKIKEGRLPISFETAIRLERAQKESPNPLKAEELMTFVEHRALYRYVIGADPAPEKIELAYAKPGRKPGQKTERKLTPVSAEA